MRFCDFDDLFRANTGLVPWPQPRFTTGLSATVLLLDCVSVRGGGVQSVRSGLCISDLPFALNVAHAEHISIYFLFAVAVASRLFS